MREVWLALRGRLYLLEIVSKFEPHSLISAQVMWEGSGWKPISIGDLLEPRKVKRAYYRASRFVHPDKLVNLSVEQRFVGKRIFDALSQAYAEFEESGMG